MICIRIKNPNEEGEVISESIKLRLKKGEI